jgi:hypothetical protein
MKEELRWIRSQGVKAPEIPVKQLACKIIGLDSSPNSVPTPDVVQLYHASIENGVYKGSTQEEIDKFLCRALSPILNRHSRKRVFSTPLFGNGVFWPVHCGGETHWVGINGRGAVVFPHHSKEQRIASLAAAVLGMPLPECMTSADIFRGDFILPPGGTIRGDASSPGSVLTLVGEIRFVRKLLKRLYPHDPCRRDISSRREIVAQKLVRCCKRVLRRLGYRRIKVVPRKRLSIGKLLGIPMSWFKLYFSGHCAVLYMGKPHLVLKEVESKKKVRLTLLAFRENEGEKLRKFEVSIPKQEVTYVDVRRKVQRADPVR